MLSVLRIAKLLSYSSRTRSALIIAVLSVLLFAVPGQTLELYLIYAQGLMGVAAARSEGQGLAASQDFWIVVQLGCGLVATVALSALLWASAVRQLAVSDTGEDAPAHVPRLRHELTAAAIAVVPIGAVILGFYNALANVAAGQEDGFALTQERWWLTLTAAVLVGLAALNTLFYAFVLRGRGLPLLRGCFSWRGLIAAAVIVAVIVGVLVWQPVMIASTIGTLAVCAAFLSVLTVLLTVAACTTHRYKIPIVVPVVIAAIAFAWTGRTDNHRVRYEITTNKPPQLEEAFIRWFEARADRDRWDGKGPYPIYLVSAEGGGIYAAYHAASYLATMQDECPSFSQHLFAVSTVSGGSLGGSLFAALAERRAENAPFKPCGARTRDGEFNRFVRSYFAHDFLSPLVAAALFPDFLQRLIPYPIPAFDRGRAIEYAFEQAWTRAAQDIPGGSPKRDENPFQRPFDEVGGVNAASPALFLHATSAVLGSRVTMSPLGFQATPTTNHLTEAVLGFCDQTNRTVEMPLSTAVGLSARFPWVMPAGWIERPPAEAGKASGCPGEEKPLGNRLYLADGGYFENSGLEQAIEIAARLRRVIEKRGDLFPKGAASAEIRIIQIAARDRFAERWSRSDFGLTFGSRGELMAPLEALMATRSARTRSVEDATRADKYYYTEGPWRDETSVVAGVPGTPEVYVPGYHRVIMDGTRFFLPLGWHLSATTRSRIETAPGFWPNFSKCMIRSELMMDVAPELEQQLTRCKDDSFKSVSEPR